MAAISLFWYTNMAAVTSDENDLYPIWSRRPKSAIFGVLSALVKDSRQFKQRENRLLKDV
jgi:hypothetical protein